MAKKTSIGGSALIEGVMMRGPRITAMAVRKPDKTIYEEKWENDSGKKPWYKTTPFIRGVFNFFDSISVSYKCLIKSSDIAEGTEENKSSNWLNALAIVLGVVLAVGLFIILPTTLIGLLRKVIDNQFVLSLCESLTKIAIFIIYIWAIGLVPDMRRTFQYHGAEHKTIFCYENGLELTVENVRKMSRFHPRCGTSFMVFILIISALIFSLVPWSNLANRMALKLLFLPLVMGVSYEIIKWAGRSNNKAVCLISKPGLWVQRLTTREPDDDMIECAIAAMKPCIPENENEDKW